VISWNSDLLPVSAVTGQLTYTNNVMPETDCVISGDNACVGDTFDQTMATCVPGATFTNNVMEDNQFNRWHPAGNSFYAYLTLSSHFGANLRWTGTESTTDGRPVGADISGLLSRISGLSLP
jgi:hypothetical protein